MNFTKRVIWLALLSFVPVCGLAAAEGDGENSRAKLVLQPIAIGKPQRIEIHPGSIHLASPSRKTQVVVTGFYDDGRVQDLTRAAELLPADSSLISVKDAYVRPMKNGRTDLLVKVAGLEQKIAVEVTGQENAEPVSFLYGTLAALSKNHCNSGGCHGAPSGKGGFSLSMVAFDPESDKLTLTRDQFNRRLQPLDPESSLLLRKPTMQVGHRGGLRLTKEEESYEVLVEWMKQGCQFDPPNQPTCVKIAIEPATRRVLRWPAHTQQLRVVATFSDGSQRDITRLAMYASSEESLATVTSNGLVVGHGRGQVGISVRYLEHVEACYLTFVRDIEGFAWTNPSEANFVDTHVYAKLRQLQFEPATLATDEEFVRRVFLDVIGLLPTVDETRSFLKDSSPDKRRRLIDSLLERPEFAKYWAFKWGDLLRVQPLAMGEEGMHKFHRWLIGSWQSNMPYDQFARELLTADGNTYENPPAGFYRISADTPETVETMSQVFLGSRLTCAKCHNHPFDRWTQDNYFGLGAFFDRVKRKKLDRNEMLVYQNRRGEITQPRTGKQMKPWVPVAGELDIAPETDRRAVFADWLTQPNNPFFARVEANRLWSHLMGRGIVEPIDDFRDSNPPSNPELLDALAREFAEHKFDRKHLLRMILNSRTYQASSRPTKFNLDDDKYFSHSRQRLLSAEQLLDALSRVTDSHEKFGNMPVGVMATQMAGPAKGGAQEFLVAFGQPQRQSSCSCERQTQAGLTQTLQMFNGQTVFNKVNAATKRIQSLIAQKQTDAQIIGEFYLASLCREPKENELQAATDFIASQPDRVAALQDVVWAVLNTREFLYRR